jgi:phosphoribosylanthranilate isomerase
MSKNPSIKICGITNLEDALFAIKQGANALGWVFYEPSPRYITPNEARNIIEQLPPFITNVGLFVNLSSDEINSISKEAMIDRAQIHFEPIENGFGDSFFDSLTIPHIKVVRAKSKEDLSKYKDEYRIVDAFVKSYGGEGKRLNLEWFDNNEDDIDYSKIIIAGGLTPSNLSELKKYDFYGYDVSSGVENSNDKRRKDYHKIMSFIKNAR